MLRLSEIYVSIIRGVSVAVSIMLLTISQGCVDAVEYTDDPYGNFDALAEIVDTRYCFFEQKGVDW
ncbi:MAG: peptidase S41, partial [Muribaculaceae bacterium]|nr:peptidase S41 [Muribaculaceae bacterium]